MRLLQKGRKSKAMESDRTYLSRRAAEEQEASDRASNPKAKELHAEMAERYRDAAHSKTLPKTRETRPERPLVPDDFRILD